MILFRYVIKDFLKFVAGTVVLCMFLFIMFDFIHKTTKYFATYNPSPYHVFQLYLFQIPMHMAQALPIASLLGSVVTMVMLSRSNEITAMRAAGMGPLRIAFPILVGGAILCVVSFLIGEFAAPMAAKRMRYVEQVLIEGRTDAQFNQGSSWMRQNNLLFHFDDYEPLTGTMINVRVIETGPNFRPKKTYDAARAFYQTETKSWKMEQVRVVYFNTNGTFQSSELVEHQLMEMPIEPQKIHKDRRKPAELSIFELSDYISRGRSSGIDISEYIVEFQVKIAFHFAALVVCLMGLKFGYRSERSVETARSVLIAISVGLSYWFLLSSGKVLGKRGTLPPFAAAWMANSVIFCLGAFDLWRSRKGG